MATSIQPCPFFVTYERKIEPNSIQSNKPFLLVGFNFSHSHPLVLDFDPSSFVSKNSKGFDMEIKESESFLILPGKT